MSGTRELWRRAWRLTREGRTWAHVADLLDGEAHMAILAERSLQARRWGDSMPQPYQRAALVRILGRRR